MPNRLRSLAFVLALGLPVAWPAPSVRAEDGAEAPKKQETDDTSVFKDWQLVKRRGARHAKTRAEFWESKGTSGKDLFFLGLMWNRGEDYAKATETLEKFLEYVPPADNDSLVNQNRTNREFARKEMFVAYMKKGDWAKCVEAAERLREEFNNSAVVPDSWCEQARAHRMAGDRDKAIDAWKQAIGMKHIASLLDLADLYLFEGDVDAAKGVFASFDMEDAKGRDAMINLYRQFLDSVGTGAPGLDAAVSVGEGEAPKDWSKPTVFKLWAMTTGNADARLKRIEELRRAYSDKIQAAGVATYNKYNPLTSKVEADMTPEQEVDWYKKLIADSPIARSLPPMIVVPKDFLEGIKLRYEGQTVIVDGEGKLRYLRITDNQPNGSPYDTLAIESMVKKLAGG